MGGAGGTAIKRPTQPALAFHSFGWRPLRFLLQLRNEETRPIGRIDMQGPPMSFEVAPSGGNATDNTSKEACLSDGGYLPQQSMAALQRRTSQVRRLPCMLMRVCPACGQTR